MSRLDFICVGPQKTSTTWLDTALRAHPQISLPRAVKETFFFDENYRRGFDWFWRQFGTPAAGAVRGEIGPSYFDDSQARQRLREHNPQLRVIVCLRDPVERTYSLYCHHYARGRVKGAFAEAVRAMPRIVESGDYAAHVAAWARDFGAGRVLLLRQEDVRARPAAVLDAVSRFLGLEPVVWPSAAEAVYERPRPRSLLLSTLAARGARVLRGLGLHRAVALADRLGLRRLVFGARQFEFPALTDADRAALEARYAGTRAWLATLDFSSGAARLDAAALAP